MKRSSSLASELGGEPSKRIRELSELGGELNGENVLKYQNKMLSQALRDCKRQLESSQEEGKSLVKKNREMENIVSILQRAWSQLEIDIAMIIDNLSEDTQNVMQADKWSDEKNNMLTRYLSAGEKFALVSPLDTFKIKDSAKWDKFTSDEDINKEKDRLLLAVNQAKVELNEINSDLVGFGMNHDCESGEVTEMREKLAERTAFTKSLLEKVCRLLCPALFDASGNFSGDLSSSTPSVAGNSVSENSRSDNSSSGGGQLMRSISGLSSFGGNVFDGFNRITKLTSDVIELSADLQRSENSRLRTERMLDETQSLCYSGDTKEVTESSECAVDASLSHSNSTPATTVDGTIHSSSEEVSALSKRVNILEKYLHESEAEKASAQTALAEHLASGKRTTGHNESEILIESIRSQHKSRVATLVTEITQLHDRIRDLELTLKKLEESNLANTKELITVTETVVRTFVNEKECLSAELLKASSSVGELQTVKAQLKDALAMEALSRRNNDTLKSDVEKYKKDVDTKEDLLQKHRLREVEWETKLAKLPDGILSADIKDLVASAQQKYSHLTNELDGKKSKMLEMMDEIEEIASRANEEHAVNVSLQNQLTSLSSENTVLTDDKNKLKNEVMSLKIKISEFQNKLEAASGVGNLRQEAMNGLKESEEAAQDEVRRTKFALSEFKTIVAQKDIKLEELSHQCGLAKKENDELRGNLKELQAVCTKAVTDAQAERKKRLEAETNAGGGERKSGESGKDVEKDMLNMTLKMLRCSICRDRFKSVVITRCYHLFCKECMEDSLKSRNRKCPACGEKYDKSDVKQVFFTH